MSKGASAFYRREIPDLALSVERCTERVPRDGKFHIVRDGQVLESFKSERRAVARFRVIACEMGFSPESIADRPASAVEQDLDRYFEAKEMYWAESHKHVRRGGAGR